MKKLDVFSGGVVAGAFMTSLVWFVVMVLAHVFFV
jgi:hypothetical protein